LVGAIVNFCYENFGIALIIIRKGTKMNINSKGLPRKRMLATFITSALAFGAGAQDLTSNDLHPKVVDLKPVTEVNKDLNNNNAQLKNYYIVELTDKPLATYKGELPNFAATSPSATSGKDKLDMQSASVKSYAGYLKSQQDAVISQLQSRVGNVKVMSRLDTVMNGLIVEVAGNRDVESVLASVPGVKKVYEHELYYAKTDQSLDLINAPDVWEALGGQSEAGKGVKVAVIDGGINSRHPMFAAEGHERPADVPNDDYCSVVDPGFCNGKLAVARYYTPTFQVHPDEQISPEDFGGHGTHVAGTAVGNPVSTTYQGVDVNLSGVAPGATLMVYKALFQTPAGTGSGSNVMLVQALEDAVEDGADIINNSWGGGPGGLPQTSPYTPIFEAAEEAGVVIATAAGNDGPADRSIGCPGCAESGLTVANTQHGRTFGNIVDAAGLEGFSANAGDGDFELNETISGPMMPVELIDEANVEACNSFADGALEGHIAFVSRGTCAFSDKANNVQAAGAIGMVLYNNAEGIIIMSMPGATLPSVSITQEAGQEILAAYTEGATATINATESLIDEDSIDRMAASSSRGPNGDSSFLKPNIAAPGTSILSAYAATPEVTENYNAISGTSMASPHVAGAAALLRQMYPDFSAKQIKSMLMTSANPNVTDLEDGEVVPATPFDRGAGRLDISNSTKAGITLDKPSLVSNGCVVSCDFTRVVTNLSDADVEWNVSAEMDSLNATVDAPSTLAIEADGTAELSLSVNTEYASVGWTFGTVTLTDPSGTFAPANIPIAVYASASDSEAIINTVVENGEFAAGATVDMLSTAGATGDSSASSLVTRIPEGTTLVEGSVMATEVGMASRNGLSISPAGNVVTWAGSLGLPESSIYPVNFPYAGLSIVDGLGMGNALGCAGIGGCDEESLNLDFGLTFEYGGREWTSLTFNTNGVLAFGDQPIAGTWMNSNMPNPAAPNNMVAPFWTDLELLPENNADFYYASLNDGVNDWLVLEWYNASVWGSSTGETYTFSVWINLDSNEVFYNYADVGSLPSYLTVGMEDISGSIGASYHFNGEGSAVTTGDAVSFDLRTDVGRAEVRYSIKLPEIAQKTEDLSFVIGWDDSQTIDLSSAYTPTSLLSNSHVSFLNGDNIFDANQAFSIEAEGELTFEVTTQPTQGTLEQVTETVTDEDGNETEQVVPGQYTYTPEAEYLGEDSFGFIVKDEAGVVTSEQMVSIEVLEPNDPPEVTSAVGSENADGEIVVDAETGTNVTLSVNAEDPDGDDLTYVWTQVSGPAVEFEGQGTNEITFAAPSSASDVAFEVMVDDGRHTVSQAFNVAVSEPAPVVEEETDSSSSSFGLLIGLLALPFAILRRRMRVAR
jgi:subtilisin family serine protease